jgi:tripartite-type tricarboxylate transporter receptor subunit TctC
VAILRSCVNLIALSCVIGLTVPDSRAQAYPSKVVRYVVTDGGGSAVDILARIVAEGLSAIYGQQVIVDNRPGAGGNIGADMAAHAPADGYTMVQIATTHTVNASLYKSLGYDLVRDFAPVTELASAPAIAVVPVSSPAKSIGDLIRMAKAKPGELTYASAGSGTCGFLAAELFRRQASVDMVHVPYKGGSPAVTAVISGESSVIFAPLAAALQQVVQGKIACIGGVYRPAPAYAAGISNDRRSGSSGLRVFLLVWSAGAGKNSPAYCRGNPQRGDQGVE